MIKENSDFLQRHVEFIKKKNTGLEKYLVDNEVDFIVMHYLGLDGVSASFRQEEGLLSEKFNRTLELVKGFTRSVPLALIKMLPGYEVVRSDVDIITPEAKHVSALGQMLSENGFRKLCYPCFYRWQPANERFKQIWIHGGNDFLNVHLHSNIAWGGVLYLEGREVFSSLEKADFLGKEFSIPSNDTALRIHILHIIFENFRFTFRDILEINQLIYEGADFDKLKGRESPWFIYAVDLFRRNFYLLRYKTESFDFPSYLGKNKLIKARIKKITEDIISGRNFTNVYFESEAYFFDFLKLCIIRPLRERGIIK